MVPMRADIINKIKIKQLLGNQIIRGISGAMLLKIASAVISFALFSLAANAAGPEEFGRFSIFFSVASILSVLAAGGQELQIVRAWNEYLTANKPGLARGALRYGWIVALSGAFIVASCFAAFLWLDSEATPLHVNGDGWLIVATIAFLITNSLSLFSLHTGRAIVSIWIGDAQYELVWRIIAIAFLSGCLFTGHMATTTEMFFVFAFGLMLVILIQTIVVSHRVAKEVGDSTPEYDTAQWTPRSFRLWMAAVMESTNQYMEVFLIGLLLDPLAAGAYFVASRLANAFALAASGLYTYGTRRVPSLYYGGKTEELKKTLHIMALMTLLVVIGGLAVFIIGGDYLLMIFGREYAAYYHVLLILSIGTALVAANGPVPSFLMLTGSEGRYMVIVAASVLFRIVGFILIIPNAGITGAAMVTTIVLVTMTLYLNYLCRKLSGMDPSILRLVHESPDCPPEQQIESKKTEEALSVNLSA